MSTILKCKMCGGDIEVSEDMTVGTCLYCGSTMTLPRIDSEKKARLFNRANQYRQNCEFDKAYRAYEVILEEDEQEAEAYWGLILAEYGVEYVEDPKTRKRIPTCHRTQTKFVLDSTNYELACKYADSEMQMMYQDEAEQLDKIQKRIISISTKEEPYDVFICYKETDDATGERTKDSVLGYEIYEALTKRNIRTFMSRVTLADKLGEDYEPYIYSALSSAKVMIVVATNGDHLDAIWVKNEWMRYLSFMKEDEKKTIIPVYKDMSPYEFPNELTRFQAQDMSKVGAEQDLVMGIQKLLGSVKADNTSAQIRNLVNESNKQNKRMKGIIAGLIVILIGISTVGGYFIYKNSVAGRYQTAKKELEKQEYYDAASILSGLGNYKDSYELYNEANILSKYKTIQDRYINANIGDEIEFGVMGDKSVKWTCLDIIDDKILFISNGVFFPQIKYPGNKRVLNSIGLALSEDEEGVFNYYEDDSIELLSEDQVLKYYPTEESRLAYSIYGSKTSSPWYINGGQLDDGSDNIKYISEKGEIIQVDMTGLYVRNITHAAIRPVMYLSKNPITNVE